MIPSSLKLSFRLLVRRKGYTAISLFGIALTLVVLVVGSAILDGVVGRGAPQQEAPRTLILGWMRLQSVEGSTSGQVGLDFVDRTVRDLPGAAEVAVSTGAYPVDAWVGEREVELQLMGADAPFWRIHRFRFLEGAPFAEDDVEQARNVTVLAESAARLAFGAPPFVGREIGYRGGTFRVVGVVEDVSTLRQLVHATAWTPLTNIRGAAGALDNGLHGPFTAEVIANTRRDLPRLRREIAARIAAIPVEPGQELQAHPDSLEESIARHALPPRADGRAPIWSFRAHLVAAALAFLALPVLNLVNLSLGRVLERSTEIGVRKAFGATPARLVAQFVGENVVLVLAGAVIAIAVTPFVLHAIDASGLLPGSRLELDLRVLAWGIAWALVFGVVSGAWPAWRMARWHPVEALRGRSTR